MQLLKGILINANLGCLVLIYLALLNVTKIFLALTYTDMEK